MFIPKSLKYKTFTGGKEASIPLPILTSWTMTEYTNILQEYQKMFFNLISLTYYPISTANAVLVDQIGCTE